MLGIIVGIIVSIPLLLLLIFALWDLHHSIKAKKLIVNLIYSAYFLSDGKSHTLNLTFERFINSHEVTDLISLRNALLDKLVDSKDYNYYHDLFYNTYALNRYMKDIETEINRSTPTRTR